MNNRLFKLYTVLGMVGLGMLLATGANAAKPAKIDLCHVPNGDPLKIKAISVGGKGGALADHHLHGDWRISGEMCDAIADNNCDGVPDPAADDADCAARLGGNATCMDGTCQPGISTPVGTITADITRGGSPPGSDRGVESAAGNLVADTQLWSTSSNGAQIAFMNPGGVRSDLVFAQSAAEGDGVVTYGEAFTFQPFGNTLLTFPMTGSQIVDVLEEQCQPTGSSRPILHLGVSNGFTYDLAVTIVAGDCTAVTVSNVRLHALPLGPTTSYQVTANNFLAGGGDNFGTFPTSGAESGLNGGSDLEALTNYLTAFSPVAPPGTDRVNEIAP